MSGNSEDFTTFLHQLSRERQERSNRDAQQVPQLRPTENREAFLQRMIDQVEIVMPSLVQPPRATRPQLDPRQRINMESLIQMMMNPGSSEVFSRVADIPLEHPNYRHCPQLYSSYPGRVLFGAVERRSMNDVPEFPRVSLTDPEDWDIFDHSYTFYPAVSAPADLDDIYGIDYVTREKIYGFCKPVEPDSLVFYSSEELVETFLHFQDFVDPKDSKKRFTRLHIIRLVYLLMHKLRDVALLDTIEAIQEMLSDVEYRLERLSQHSNFKPCLKMILNAGMYMRGWSGEGPFPLDSLSTNGDISESKLLETLLELKSKLEYDWSELGSIPLYKWQRGQAYPDDDCPTLMDRLLLVMRPSRPDSCIRNSSNVFCTTAYIHLDKFYNEHPFDLTRLREIL